MFVSQPLVTKYIKRLEENLNIKLFERNSKFVTLTNEGEYLYSKLLPIWNDLNPIWNDLNNAFNKIKIIDCLSNSSIKINALYGFNFENIILKYINTFEEKYTDIQIDFQIYSFEELNNNIDSLDIIFTTNYELRSNDNYNILPLVLV